MAEIEEPTNKQPLEDVNVPKGERPSEYASKYFNEGRDLKTGRPKE